MLNLFNKTLCKCPIDITGCWGATANLVYQELAQRKEEGIFSLQTYSEMPFAWFLWLEYMQYALSDFCLEFHIKVKLAWTSALGCLRSARLWCFTLPLRRSGKSLPYYRCVCLPFLRPHLLPLSFSCLLQGKPCPPCVSEWLYQHPWKAREAAASCWFMGHPTGGLEEQLPALHWLMLYPTGISTASVTSPAVMGREQQQWYPLQSDLRWLNPILFNLKILSVVLLSIQRLQEPKMAYH